MKELEDLESTRNLRTVSRRDLEFKESMTESGVERVDALRVIVLTQGVQCNPLVVQGLGDC